MIAYKIVRRTEDGKLMSLSMPRAPYRVEYRPKRWATAPIGGLLVFSTLERAKSFYSRLIEFYHQRDIEIWEAEVKEEVPLPDGYATASPIDRHENEGVLYSLTWELAEGKPIPENVAVDMMPWPEATAAYRRVKLVKRLA